MRASASAGRFAVIGEPVEHSQSPRIFGFLRQVGVFGGSYEALRVKPADLEAAVGRLRSGEFQGFSVTLPHKESVLVACDELSAEARQIGAVNCLVGPRPVKGHNTDAVGLVRALRQHSLPLRGARVLLLGAGGAARAAAFAAVEEGCESLVIANRSLPRAQKLAALFDGALVEAVPLEAAGLAEAARRATLVVNATRVGLGSFTQNPVPRGVVFGPSSARMDMVYQPLKTAFLEEGERVGAATLDGLWMLVHQALEQLRLWTGYEAREDLAVALYQHLHKEPA